MVKEGPQINTLSDKIKVITLLLSHYKFEDTDIHQMAYMYIDLTSLAHKKYFISKKYKNSFVSSMVNFKFAQYISLNFQPLEVVYRYREVVKNYLYLFIRDKTFTTLTII